MSKDKLHLTIIIGLLIALVISCISHSQQEEKRLSVSEIIIPKEGLIFQTSDGRMVLRIRASEYGGELNIINNIEKFVVNIGAGEDGGMLVVNNNQSTPAVSMVAGEDGGGLWVNNNQGKPAAAMFGKDGGMLGIYNNQGRIIWSKP